MKSVFLAAIPRLVSTTNLIIQLAAIHFGRRLGRQIHLEFVEYYPVFHFRPAVSPHFQHPAVGMRTSIIMIVPSLSRTSLPVRPGAWKLSF
jgi:hypothetical protein